MRRLSLIICLFLMVMPIMAQSPAQSPHGDDFKINCNQCHNPSGWELDIYLMRFDHNKKTNFKLEGAHTQTDCKACHASLVFNQAPDQCASCHKDIHSMSVGNDCAQCHTTNTWIVNNIPEIHEENGFPLIGSHGGLSCNECHTSETSIRFDRIGNDCISCHKQDYDATQSPNHSELGFSTDCIECHTPLGTGWDSQNINHDFFPLTQGHDIQDCKQCHKTNNYSDASPECISCHQTDFNNTQNPNHSSVGFSTDCASCHTTNPGWTPANINHDFFPLTMGHDIQDCKECHKTDNYADADPNCVSCHQTDYDNTQNPIHRDTGFSTDCASCHTTNPGWTPANINHDFFPLTMGHDIQDCKECHKTDNYADADPNCVSCHQTDYDNTQNPIHRDTGFSTDCASCHTTNPGWTPANINHDFFPLTLGHDIQDCKQCHKTNNYADADPNCVSCHQTDYDNTQNPIHRDAGFSTDCVTCHTTNPGWTPATINHDFFPLTMGHDIQDCKQCHKTNNYADADPNCVSCHQTDYNNTNNPNHSTNGFSTDCASCHTTNPGWTPATINHDFFPLTLGHDIQDCKQCHTTNSYADASPECISCHQTDYNNTNDPNHQAAHFPTDCATCHTTNPNWKPAQFDHDGQYFPIYSGKHRQGEAWNDCVECHTNPNDYSSFSCITCHEHSNKNDVDNKHRGENGYVYESNACYECHPNGRG
ncbi:hypothetical protein [Yeosuana marina]|uniref:hypothetical protein n=1 Tax=Yeosuana marina TaxID=1565536 RepID=UPI0030EB4C7D